MKHFSVGFFILFAVLTLFGQSVPEPPREFRGVWIATVDNIDFPTKKGLSVSDQKAELIRNLELAESLRLNAVVFQVRPMADALYPSKIEPWSEFLTGEMGRPQPFDPLGFLIDEAHKRGILVHAWFNPYRAYHPAAKTVSPKHISKTRPDLVRQYGKYLWLDPSEKEVQKYSLSVVLDVVRRYDIDGIHFDDYFYPYPETDADKKRIEFPDDKNWQAYQKAGGTLSRDDWRRKNVDDFIRMVGRETKRIKPWVMYGVSPFGIWQPMPDKGITGFNAYRELYADAKKWLQEGTIDYLAPQLYWETARQGQSFPVLFDWWKQQNTLKRHVWVGIAPYRIGSNANFTADEIVNQISLTRKSPETGGTIGFSFKSLRNDLGGIQQALSGKVFRQAAIIPASPWMRSRRPSSPKVTVTRDPELVRARWTPAGPVKPFWYVVYAKDKSGWSYSVLPGTYRTIALKASRGIEKVIVTAVDRLGNESYVKR